jgi:hypothetical protein
MHGQLVASLRERLSVSLHLNMNEKELPGAIVCLTSSSVSSSSSDWRGGGTAISSTSCRE